MIGQDPFISTKINDKNNMTNQRDKRHLKSINAETDKEMTNTKIASGKMKSSQGKNVKHVS